MPLFVREEMQTNPHKKGYIYNVSGEDLEDVGNSISGNADEPVTFVGKVGDKKANLPSTKFISTTLARPGGEVAASARIAGEQAIIRFLNMENILIIPTGNGSKYDADALMGLLSNTSESSFIDEGEPAFSGTQNSFGFGTGAPPIAPNQYSSPGYERDMMEEYGQQIQPLDHIEQMPDVENFAQYPGYGAQENEEPVSVVNWLITIILMAIPIVNIVYAIKTILSANENQSKKNYMKVDIIFAGISTFASIIMIAMMFLNGGSIPSFVPLQNGNAIVQSANNATTTPGIQNVNVTNEPNGNGGGEPVQQNPVEPNPIDEPVAEPSPTYEIPTLKLNGFDATKTLEGRNIAIGTISVKNTGSTDITPSNIFVFDARQGQNILIKNTAEQDGFVPATISEPIPAGSEATFQFSFYLVDDQPFHLIIADNNGNLLLEETRDL